MADIDALRVQKYATNLEMLLQQRGAPFRNYCRTANAAGASAYRYLSQVGRVEYSRQKSVAEPIDNAVMNLSTRWVHAPMPAKFQTIVDNLDLMLTNIEPTGAYVTSAVEALNRQSTDAFLAAFFGTAKTGDNGGSSTTFTSGNIISASTGAGGDVGLTVEKLRAVKKLAASKFCDFGMERPVMGLNAKAHDDLLALTQVTSADFNGSRPTLVDGRVTSFMGIDFIMSEQIGLDSTNTYYALPFWLPSGMGEAVWYEQKVDIREIPTMTDKPRLVEALSCIDYTRLEEDKCYQVNITTA